MSSTIKRESSITIDWRSSVPKTTIGSLIERHEVCSVYQPLIDLQTGETVGFEALARGPHGSALERPDALFEAARTAEVETELEWECQRAALEGAMRAGLAPGQALFMNLEPGVSMANRPQSLCELTDAALGRFPIFVELTERALTYSPAELLRTVRWIRQRGAGIALDDVGADPRSLALMPFLAPEVIKLDLRLVQANPSGQLAEIVHAVGAEAERTGALVLAEGIETETHRQTALALGASYGQGWLFGRPDVLARPGRAVRAPIRHPSREVHDGQTPFEVLTRTLPTRQGTKRLLLALSLQMEAQAANLGPLAVLLSSFQEAEYFSPVTAKRYSRISNSAALVGALGVGLSEHPAEGVRGAALDQTDPLRGEWDVTVIGPHFAMAFVARELGDDGPDMDRRFDFAVTYNRETAIHAARAMMGRLAHA